MKKNLLFILFSLIFSLNCNAQIRNLNDLLLISKLSIKDMMARYQYTWKLDNVERDKTENGNLVERYLFTYEEKDNNQIIKKSGMLVEKARTIAWVTTFKFSNPKLLEKITNSLPKYGFEKKGYSDGKYMYENDNTVLILSKKKNYNEISVVND